VGLDGLDHRMGLNGLDHRMGLDGLDHRRGGLLGMRSHRKVGP
jgi:hypothetical protein